ncbi:DUF2752 domain-containing protein [Mucisphaera calidilacus]|nr:DUF2752 domain-containing protein [Mucisphaera calidilacus]
MSGRSERSRPRQRSASSAKTHERLAGVLVALICLAVMIGLYQLEPEARGYGTHGQFASQPCGWVEQYDLPCPTCGVTTSASLAAHGSLLASFWTQPLGLLIMLSLSVVFWQQLGVALFGWATMAPGRMLLQRSTWLALIAITLFSWGWKFLTWT